MITTPTADQLNVELDAPLLTVEPGGAPVTLSLRIENRSSIVDRFSVHVAGLDPDWFTLSSSVVALFPGDTEQIGFGEPRRLAEHRRRDIDRRIVRQRPDHRDRRPADRRETLCKLGARLRLDAIGQS